MERAERSILKKATNGGRLKTMMAVDFRRLFTMRLLYIMVGICLVVPILVLVMTTMMDGSVSVDPKTGAETAMHAFSSVWQSIGSTSGSGMMSMDMTSMCNINLVYFAVAVFICLFVSDDFRSGYAKNLFAVRAGRMEYVISNMLNYFIREGEYVGSLMGILNCFAEILDAHRNQKYLSLRETTGIPDSCYHPLGYLRVVADAEEKIKKGIYVKNVRVLIENDLQDYLKYRAHLWLDEQIRFMIQDDPKKGTV